jgi:hypothetical protein
MKVGTSPAQAALLIGGVIFAAGLLDDEVQAVVQHGRNTTSNSVARVGNTFGTGAIVFPVLMSAWVAARHWEGRRPEGSRARLDCRNHRGLTSVAIKHLMGRLRPNSGFDSDHIRLVRKEGCLLPVGAYRRGIQRGELAVARHQGTLG